MCSSVRKYIIWTSMLANYIFINKFYNCFCVRCWGCTCFRPFGQVISCYDYITVSFVGQWQWSYKVYSYFLKGLSYWYWVQESTVFRGLPSSLTRVTGFNIISNVFKH